MRDGTQKGTRRNRKYVLLLQTVEDVTDKISMLLCKVYVVLMAQDYIYIYMYIYTMKLVEEWKH